MSTLQTHSAARYETEGSRDFRVWLTSSGTSQRAFANRLEAEHGIKVSQQTVGSWAAGDARPEDDKLEPIAAITGIAPIRWKFEQERELMLRMVAPILALAKRSRREERAA